MATSRDSQEKTIFDFDHLSDLVLDHEFHYIQRRGIATSEAHQDGHCHDGARAFHRHLLHEESQGVQGFIIGYSSRRI